MGDAPEPNGTVRVTLGDVYRLVFDTRDQVRSLDQTVRDVVQPSLVSVTTRLDVIDKAKVDKDNLDEVKDRVKGLEMKVYVYMAALVAALSGGKFAGLL